MRREAFSTRYFVESSEHIRRAVLTLSAAIGIGSMGLFQSLFGRTAVHTGRAMNGHELIQSLVPYRRECERMTPLGVLSIVR